MTISLTLEAAVHHKLLCTLNHSYLCRSVPRGKLGSRPSGLNSETPENHPLAQVVCRSYSSTLTYETRRPTRPDKVHPEPQGLPRTRPSRTMTKLTISKENDSPLVSNLPKQLFLARGRHWLVRKSLYRPDVLLVRISVSYVSRHPVYGTLSRAKHRKPFLSTLLRKKFGYP